jgi:glycosyltransferase involved in cell wall biosynthesis
MRILVITDYLPYPLIAGDRIRVYNLVRRLARHHQVSLVALLGTPDDEASLRHLGEFCEYVSTADHTWHSLKTEMTGMLQYFLTGKPWELRLVHSEKLAETIRQLTSQNQYDIIDIQHSRMALYREEIAPSCKAKTVLTLHNIAYMQYEIIARIQSKLSRKLRDWLHSRALWFWEPRYAAKFDHVITMSQLDTDRLLKRNSRLTMEVIPNGVDTQKYQPLPLKENHTGLLFIGTMAYPPCADGARYFCRQILPLVDQQFPEVETWIVGADPPPDVAALSADRIHVTGRVEDILPYYQRTSICVVPLRAGGGTRLKILEAMALGRPVVTTSIGCEGLEAVNGKHLLIADDPAVFASHINRLLSDADLYRSISQSARQFVESHYGWDAIAEKLMRLYETVRMKA